MEIDDDPVKTAADEIHLTLLTHNWRDADWYRLDDISEHDVAFIKRVVRGAFAPLLMTATDTPGFLVVSRAHRLIESLLLVGLRVPCPVSVNRHVTRVVDNTFDVFYDLMEADLNRALRPTAMRQLNL